MASNWPYSPQQAVAIGEPFAVSTLQDFSEKFQSTVISSDNKDSLSSKFVVNGLVRNAEFFGLDTIEKVIEEAKKIAPVVGLRVYYGLAYEALNVKTGESEISTKPIEGGDPELRPRLFLVAVDENGDDIKTDTTGLKEGPDGNGFGNGSPQPPYGQP